MIRFEYIEFLYALLLLPIFISLYSFMAYWRKKAINRYGDEHLINKLMPGVSRSRMVIRFVIFLLAFTSLIIAISNPQIGSKIENAKRKGIDLIIALDVSNSMLAQDIKPNRLSASKQAISKLIDKLKGDRVGIIVFAGHAYTQLPITTDYAAAKMFLNTVNPDMLPVQGTAIGEAIMLSSKSFGESEHNKAIIIITDGENHEGDALKAVEEAVELGIVVYTIGMGLPEGGPIPIYKDGELEDYKKDREGSIITTKLNEPMLQQIAAAGQGIYVRANNSQAGLNKIFEEIDRLEESEFETKTFSDYEDRFQYFLVLTIILLIIEFIIVERKSKWSDRIKLFE
jgi:Ca-activated chloride channel family protein